MKQTKKTNTCEYAQKTGVKNEIYCKAAKASYSKKMCDKCFNNSCKSVYDIKGWIQLEIIF